MNVIPLVDKIKELGAENKRFTEKLELEDLLRGFSAHCYELGYAVQAYGEGDERTLELRGLVEAERRELHDKLRSTKLF